MQRPKEGLAYFGNCKYFLEQSVWDQIMVLLPGQGIWTFCCRQWGIIEGFLGRGMTCTSPTEKWRGLDWGVMVDMEGKESCKRDLGSKIIESGRMQQWLLNNTRVFVLFYFLTLLLILKQLSMTVIIMPILWTGKNATGKQQVEYLNIELSDFKTLSCWLFLLAVN